MSIVKMMRKCPGCGTVRTLTVSEDGLLAWREGLKIQLAFPAMSPNDREFLMTGICQSCWDEMWKEEE